MLAYLGQCFKAYRGGMKFYFRFITSQFVTTRIRISHYPSVNTPSSIEFESGDNVSTVIDVRGDGEYCLPVPYIGALPYKQIPGYNTIDDSANCIPADEDDSYIVVSLADKITNPTPDGVAGVFMLIYAAAAEDMVLKDFIGYQGRKSAVELAAEADGLEIRKREHDYPVYKKQSIDKIFAKPFAPLAGAKATAEAGLVCVEHYSTVEELTHRMIFSDIADGNTYIPNNLGYQPLTGDSTLLNDYDDTLVYIARCFQYYRGGIRYRLILPLIKAEDGSYSRIRTYAQLTIPSGGNYVEFRNVGFDQWFDLISWADSSLDTVHKFEIPWMAGVPARPFYRDWSNDFGVPEKFFVTNWDSNATLSTNGFGTGLSPVDTFVVYRGTADDFQFGTQLPPPVFEISGGSLPPISKKKEKEKETLSSLSIKQPTVTDIEDIEQSVTSKTFDALFKAGSSSSPPRKK